MPIIQFKATNALSVYHDRPDYIDGTTREVSDESARYLTETFPLNFIVLEGKAVPAPPENKVDPGRTEDKAATYKHRFAKK